MIRATTYCLHFFHDFSRSADRCRFYKRRCRFVYSPVCGTDGKTYPNHCQLRKVTCVSNGKVNMAHNGKCRKLIVLEFET